jgi:hypothetical protein
MANLLARKRFNLLARRRFNLQPTKKTISFDPIWPACCLVMIAPKSLPQTVCQGYKGYVIAVLAPAAK